MYVIKLRVHTVNSPSTDTFKRWTPPYDGHLDSVPAIQILQPFLYNLTFLKMDTSLRQTTGDGPEGMDVRES